MTPSVRVIVDSTAGISPELSQNWGIDVVPLYLNWADRTYRDGIDLLPANFYALLAQSDSNPHTSAPNPAEFVEICQHVLSQGYQNILIVTVSSTMSGTYNHACAAAEMIGKGIVHVFNSGQGAGAQALIAAYAAQFAHQGAPLSVVIAAADAASRQTEIYMVVDTLKYLRRGGRISGPKAIMGELIQLKPVLTFIDGRLQVIAKCRTMKRAIQFLSDRLETYQPAQVLLMYADTSSLALQFQERLQQRWPNLPIDISPISGVVGGNTGPGALGLAVRWHSQ